MGKYLLDATAVTQTREQQFNFALDTLMQLPKFQTAFLGALLQGNITVKLVEDSSLASEYNPSTRELTLNFWEMENTKYLGTDGVFHSSSLQGTFAHEIFHGFEHSPPPNLPRLFLEQTAVEYANEIGSYFGVPARGDYRNSILDAGAEMALYGYPVFDGATGDFIKPTAPIIMHFGNIPSRFNEPQSLDVQIRCFLAGTPITMADGSTKPIEDIIPGNMVLAFDENANNGMGGLVPGKVARTLPGMSKDIIELRGLRVTPGHRFLSDNGEWVAIADCLIDDRSIVEERDGGHPRQVSAHSVSRVGLRCTINITPIEACRGWPAGTRCSASPRPWRLWVGTAPRHGTTRRPWPHRSQLPKQYDGIPSLPGRSARRYRYLSHRH